MRKPDDVRPLSSGPRHPATPTIRPARIEDALDLRDHLFAHLPILDVVSSVQTSLERAAKGEELLLVAVLAGRVVGQVVVTFHLQPSDCAHRASLDRLVVGHGWQRRGLGRALVEGAAAAAVRRQVRLLTVAVRGGTVAEPFFRAVGFNEYGRLRGGLADPFGGQFYDEVLMVRNLVV